MIDPALAEPRQIVGIEPEDNGSRITLACGHVIWSPLEPIYQGGSMYCGECLDNFIEAVRKGQRPA